MLRKKTWKNRNLLKKRFVEIQGIKMVKSLPHSRAEYKCLGGSFSIWPFFLLKLEVLLARKRAVIK